MVQHLARLQSGILGLDPILGGGFVEGASYIIQGSPGAGKTILSNQVAFAHAGSGQRVLYVTLLAETHDRLFQVLSTMSFFDKDILGDAIKYISVFQTLRDEGLHAVVRLIREETQRQGATLLVFDGLLNARDRAETDLDVKTFVAEIQSQAAFVSCTVLFLASARINNISPEHTMVDGVIDLSDEIAGVRSYRRLHVKKSRGSSSLGGFHQFEITEEGITVFPRLESVNIRPSKEHQPNTLSISSGVDGLDKLTGGLPTASVTMLMGPPGSGKTTLGLNFLDRAAGSESSLFCGFFEMPSRLVQKGLTLKLNTSERAKSGSLRILWNPLTENILDKLAHDLLNAVKKYDVKRLVIDGVGGFERAATHHGRLVEFFCALTNELRALGVTTIMTAELREVSGETWKTPLPDISSILDNLIILRHDESGPTPKRMMAILKMRDSIFESGAHEFVLGDGGICLVSSVGTIGSDRTKLADQEKV